MPQRLWRLFFPDSTSQGLQTDKVALAPEQGSANVSVFRDHLLLRHSTVSPSLSLCYPSFFALQTLLVVTITHIPLSPLTIPLNLQDHPRNLRCPCFPYTHQFSITNPLPCISNPVSQHSYPSLFNVLDPCIAFIPLA